MMFPWLRGISCLTDHWPLSFTISSSRPWKQHQKSPVLVLSLGEEPVVTAPATVISLCHIFFFSYLSFAAYSEFQEQWALQAGNHLPWCQETQLGQSWDDNQSIHSLQGCLIVHAPWSQLLFFYCQDHEDGVRKSPDVLSSQCMTTLKNDFPVSTITYFFGWNFMVLGNWPWSPGSPRVRPLSLDSGNTKFIAIIFSTAMRSNQSFPSMERWLNQMWGAHTVGC